MTKENYFHLPRCTLQIFVSFSEAVRAQSVTSNMSCMPLLCFTYCKYRTTRITNVCWRNVQHGELCTLIYIYYFKLLSLRNFQGSPYFPLISPLFTTLPHTVLACGTNLENLCIIRQYGTLVRSRTLEPEYLHPPLTNFQTLRQATKLLCASCIKWRK